MKKSIFTLVAILFCIFSNAQDGSLDPTFNTADSGLGNGDGADYAVTGTAVQPDGKILIIGTFTRYNKTLRYSVARLNTDGTLDPSFNANLPQSFNNVDAMCLLPDGKILLTGTSLNNDKILRLNPDGSPAPFPGSGSAVGGLQRKISAICLQPDGKIIIAGTFTSCNGTARNHIARLNSDGSLDASFNPGNGPMFSTSASEIDRLLLLPDGKIMILGGFSAYNGIARKHIARLYADGSLDTAFDPGSGITGPSNMELNAIAAQEDGKILVGGKYLINYNGITANTLIRINSDGSLDYNFMAGTGFLDFAYSSFTTMLYSTSGTVKTILVQPDGKIMVAGNFMGYSGVPLRNILRLNPDGNLDPDFFPGVGTSHYAYDYSDGYSGTDIPMKETIYAMAALPDGKIIVAGEFSSYNYALRRRVARINPNGSPDLSFNHGSGANSEVLCSLIQPDGKILVGGSFSDFNGEARSCTARLNPDGTLDPAYISPFLGMKSYEVENKTILSVSSMALQPDGKILIVGNFNSCSGVATNRIARLNADGSLDPTFTATLPYPDQDLHGIALQPDGKILIGNSGYLIRLNPDGSIQNSKNIGSWLYSVFVLPDGKILYSTSGALKRINGDFSQDTGFTSYSINSISSLCVQPDGKIIVAGSFTSINGMSIQNVARFNSNGTLDFGFYPNNVKSVKFAKLQPDGKLLLSVSPSNITETNFIRLNADGSLDSSFNIGGGPRGTGFSEFQLSNPIKDICIQDDSKIIIVGSFSSYNAVGRNRVARIMNDVLGTPENTFGNTLKIYPNPVSTVLNVETGTDSGTKNISIYNMLGQLVLTAKTFQGQVEVSALPGGTYILRLEGEKGSLCAKFLKR